MNSPLPHSITLPWHPYLPPPSISTLTVYHLVLAVHVAVNVCVQAYGYVWICLQVCKLWCISTFPVTEWGVVDTVYCAQRCQNMLCRPSVFDRITSFLFGWVKHWHSLPWKRVRKFLHLSLRWCHSLSFPSNFSDRFRLNPVSGCCFFSFFCHLLRFTRIPLPLSSTGGFVSHPICPPVMRRELLSLRGTKVLCLIPQPHFGSERHGSFLYVSHTCTHGHRHTHKHTHAVLLLRAMVMHFHFILNFFVCSPFLSMIHVYRKREDAHREQIKLILAVLKCSIELSSDFHPH